MGGSVGDKNCLINSIKTRPNDTNIIIKITDFKIDKLSSDVILAKFITEKFVSNISTSEIAFRSSIWKQHGDNWKLFFHQGTLESRANMEKDKSIVLENQSKPIKINDKVIITHKDSNQPISLAPQQEKCFFLLLQGYSSKEIAKQINLSFRTVEHYIARLRVILGCRNTKELIFSYSNLISPQ